jgi:hypothetical protein
MAAKPKEYQRLPGRGIKRQGFLTVAVSARRTRLWLGPDHLLAVDSQWYSEDYRRFYFRDIQAIIIRKTINGKAINLVTGLGGALTTLGATVTTGGMRIFWAILAGVFIFFLGLNFLLGSTCVCRMQTAVQTEDLPSLQRLRRARKVLRRLRPLIVEAQGGLTPEDIASRLAQPADSRAPSTEQASSSSMAPPPEAPPPG